MVKYIVPIAAIVVLLVAIGIDFYQKQSKESATQRVTEWARQNPLKLSDVDYKREDFKIVFDEREWTDLRRRLDKTRYFSSLDDADRFSYGFDPNYARELVDYWRSGFDWRKQIDRLNTYKQYRATINGTIIHYIYHETNPKEGRKPTNVMLIDGWPGCSFSFIRMIEKIETEFRDVSFRVFVPSIPGYGYSTPLKRILTSADTAFLFDALMRHENAENYFVHGEDWGIFVATNLGQFFPERVRGLHLTGSLSASPFTTLSDTFTYFLGLLIPSRLYTEQEFKLDVPQKYSLSNRLWLIWSQFGYFHLQSTKPDTLSHGVTDSPVGLMAYVLEKYSTWSFDYEREIIGKRDGGLERFDKDHLLSIITIYWMTNSISSSVRFYKANVENFFVTKEAINKDIIRGLIPSRVPVGFQVGINEIMVAPMRVVRMTHETNLVSYKLVDDLGHFAGFQNPLITARNFIQFVNKLL